MCYANFLLKCSIKVAHTFKPTSKPVMSLSNGLVSYPMMCTIRVARQSCWRDYILNVLGLGNVNVRNAYPSTEFTPSETEVLRTGMRSLQTGLSVLLVPYIYVSTCVLITRLNFKTIKQAYLRWIYQRRGAFLMGFGRRLLFRG